MTPLSRRLQIAFERTGGNSVETSAFLCGPLLRQAVQFWCDTNVVLSAA